MNRHPHALAMIMYGIDAMMYRQPWRLWELKPVDDTKWTNCSSSPGWSPELIYRRIDLSFVSDPEAKWEYNQPHLLARLIYAADHFMHNEPWRLWEMLSEDTPHWLSNQQEPSWKKTVAYRKKDKSFISPAEPEIKPHPHAAAMAKFAEDAAKTDKPWELWECIIYTQNGSSSHKMTGPPVWEEKYTYRRRDGSFESPSIFLIRDNT
jgi:hypothetical protein